MVVLNKIYTRTGDDDKTGLSTGERVEKFDLRIQAYGTVDETNATLGMVRQHTHEAALQRLDEMLARILNELFDLGADLCTPDRGEKLEWESLRITASQVERLEKEIEIRPTRVNVCRNAQVRIAGRPDQPLLTQLPQFFDLAVGQVDLEGHQ